MATEMATQVVDDPRMVIAATAETVATAIAARAMGDTGVVKVATVAKADTVVTADTVATTDTQPRRLPCLRLLRRPPQMPILPLSTRMLPKHGLPTMLKTLTRTPTLRWVVMGHTWPCGSSRSNSHSTRSTTARRRSLLPPLPGLPPR
jgi:hypothetical protein